MARTPQLTADDIARLAKTVGALHEPRKSADVLGAMLDAVGALLDAPMRTGAVVQWSQAGRRAGLLLRRLVIRNLPVAAARAYEQSAVDADPLIRQARRIGAACRVFRPTDLGGAVEWEKSAAVAAMRPAGVTDSVGVLTTIDAQTGAALWFHRTERRFDARDLELLDYVLPHIRRAAAGMRAAQTGPTDPIPPVYLFDRNGALVSTNTAAQSLSAGRADPEEDSTDWGRLGAGAVTDELASLARRLWEARSEGRDTAPPKPVILGSAAYQVDASFGGARPDGEPETLLLVLRRVGESSAGNPRGRPRTAESASQALSDVLVPQGITAAELAVARLLWEARLEKQIAREIHRSRETVKSHVRSIYRKCGVSRRAEWSAWVADRLLRRSDRSRAHSDENPSE